MKNLSVGFNAILFSFLLFSPLLVHAQGVSVTATVDRNQVGVGDVINLSIDVTSEGSGSVTPPSLPQFPGLELINSSSSKGISSTYANGKFMTQQTLRFIYMYAVTQKGTLTIPSLGISVDGQTYTTQPILIAATSERANPPPQAGGGQLPSQDQFEQMDEMEELFNQMLQRRLGPNSFGQQPQGRQGGQQNIPAVNPQEAFFIHAESDKQKAYVGEQITVSFYLYTRGNIRDIDTLKYPNLKNFWKEEIEMATRLNFEQVSVNGISYQRALLVSYALFPIKAGKAMVDSYKAKCTVLTQSNFGFGRPYVFTKASKPIAIEVLDVPVADKPKNYSGAVGSFRLSAGFEPPTSSVNQPVTLRVRVEGRGNAKLIELPTLELPPSFELYDQKSQAKFLKDGTSFKEFEVLIIPREPGVFEIPPVGTAVFDPQSKKFTPIVSQPLKIAVTGTAGAAQTIAQGGVTPGKSSGDGELTLPRPAMAMEFGGISAQAMPAVTVGIYALVFGFLGFQSWSKLKRKPKRVSLNLVLNSRLKRIHALVAKNEWRRVGVELTNAIYYFIGNLSGQGGASEELSRMLEHTPPSLRSELSEPLKKLIGKCEALSFAPEEMVGELNQKAQLNTLISEFEKVIKRAIELAEI